MVALFVGSVFRSGTTFGLCTQNQATKVYKNDSQNTCTKDMLIKPPINDRTRTTGKSLMGAEGRACSLALDVVVPPWLGSLPDTIRGGSFARAVI